MANIPVAAGPPPAMSLRKLLLRMRRLRRLRPLEKHAHQLGPPPCHLQQLDQLLDGRLGARRPQDACRPLARHRVQCAGAGQLAGGGRLHVGTAQAGIAAR